MVTNYDENVLKYSAKIKQLMATTTRNYESDCMLVLAFYQFLKAKAIVDMQCAVVGKDSEEDTEKDLCDKEFIRFYVSTKHSKVVEPVERLIHARDLVCGDYYSDECTASIIAVTKGTDLYLMLMEFGLVGVGSGKTTLLTAAIDAMAGV